MQRASAMRCCCPPESCRGCRASIPPSCTTSSTRSTSLRIVDSFALRMRSGNAMFSYTVMCGKSA